MSNDEIRIFSPNQNAQNTMRNVHDGVDQLKRGDRRLRRRLRRRRKRRRERRKRKGTRKRKQLQRSSSCTMVEKRKKHRFNSHPIIHCPRSEGVSEASERANK